MFGGNFCFVLLFEQLNESSSLSEIGLLSSGRYVIRDKEQDVLYDILMTKVDVRIGEWGLYNFYKMQVFVNHSS